MSRKEPTPVPADQIKPSPPPAPPRPVTLESLRGICRQVLRHRLVAAEAKIKRLELIVGANKTSHDFTRRKLTAAREALELLDDTLCDEWGPGPWHDTQEAIIATSRAVQEDTNGED